MRARKAKPISLRRHRRDCRICAHPDKAAIEQCFLEWESPAAIAEQFALADRRTVYRHMHATGRFTQRQENLRLALGKLVEHVDHVTDVNASAIVQAVVALSKINAAGQFVEPADRITLQSIFDRMTRSELECYAADGSLPSWCRELLGDGYYQPAVKERDDEE